MTLNANGIVDIILSLEPRATPASTEAPEITRLKMTNALPITGTFAPNPGTSEAHSGGTVQLDINLNNASRGSIISITLLR